MSFIQKLKSSPDSNKLLKQERLVLAVTEAICELMNSKQVSRSELASRMKTSKSFVSQLLAGQANMTLRTLSDVVDALGGNIVCNIEGESQLTFSIVEDLQSKIHPLPPTVAWNYQRSCRVEAFELAG